MEDILAFVEFDEHRYCATSKQVEQSDLYVIDVDGVKELVSRYHGKKKMVAVFFDINEGICKNRMLARGDGAEAVEQRIRHDAIAFADAEKVLTGFNYFIRLTTSDRREAAQYTYKLLQEFEAIETAGSEIEESRNRDGKCNTIFTTLPKM